MGRCHSCVFALLLLGLIVAITLLSADPPGTKSTQPVGSEKQVRTDQYGDPLPERAIARLGTVRWQQLGRTSCVAFAPDGKTLAAGGGANETGVFLWEAATGKLVRRFLGPAHEVLALAFSPDGTRLAAGSLDQRIRVWDVATGAEVHQFHDDGRCVAFSPDGLTLATTRVRERSSDGSPWGDEARLYDTDIRLRDAATGEELWECECPRSAVTALAFSADGMTLATGHYLGREKPGGANDGKAPTSRSVVRFWEAATGKERRAIQGGPQHVRSLAFSVDGRFLAAGDHAKTIYLWDATTGTELARLDAGARAGRSLDELRQLGSSVSVVFSADGRTMVSACLDRTILIWDAATGEELGQLPDRYFPQSISPSSDGLLAIAGGVVNIWDLQSARAVDQPLRLGLVRSLTFSPDGRSLATPLGLFDAATGQLLLRLGGAVAVAFSPDGRILACGGWDSTLRLHDATSGEELHRFAASHSGFTYPAAVAFSPDGKTVVAESLSRVGIWDLATGKPNQVLANKDDLKLAIQYLNPGLNTVAFSPDGTILAWAAQNAELCLWRMTPQHSFRKFDHGSVQSVAYSPDGKLLAAAGGQVRKPGERPGIILWETSTGRLWQRFGQDLADLRAVAFSPDGRCVAGGAGDGIVRVWEVATGKERRQFRGHRGPVWCVAFAPDGKTLASGSEDGTVLLWDVTGSRDRRPAVSRPGRELEGLWTELAGADPARSFDAMDLLATAPTETLPFLRQRLRAILGDKEKQLAQLLPDLDSPGFAARERASTGLAELGSLAEPALRAALGQRPSAEARRRLEELLAKLQSPTTSPETLRIQRALEVVEWIGTDESRQVLSMLAEEMPHTARAVNANEAIQRLTLAARDRAVR